MRDWTGRQWLVAAIVAVLAGAAIGTVTALVPNPLFTRMIDAPWWSYPVWIASALLSGLLAATYVAPSRRRDNPTERGEPTDSGDPTESGPADARSPAGAPKRGAAGAVLSFLAVGCPTCNKLVVLALGTSGAVTWFEPVQPFLAVGSLALLGFALRARLRTARVCPVPAATAGP